MNSETVMSGVTEDLRPSHPREGEQAFPRLWLPHGTMQRGPIRERHRNEGLSLCHWIWPSIWLQAPPYPGVSRTSTLTLPSVFRGGDAMHGRVLLRPEQKAVLQGFTRRMPVRLRPLRAWCGDCINQCPAFDHFGAGAASSAIDLAGTRPRPSCPKSRTPSPSTAAKLGVPVLVFLERRRPRGLPALWRSRSLSIYRKLAADQLGSSCPTGLVPASADSISRRHVRSGSSPSSGTRTFVPLASSPRLRQKYWTDLRRGTWPCGRFDHAGPTRT